MITFARLAVVCIIFADLGPRSAFFAQPAAAAGVSIAQEEWLRDQISSGRPGDLNAHCGTVLDINKPDSNSAKCHVIRSSFLIPLLAGIDASKEVVLRGLDLTESVDLRRTHIKFPFTLADSRLENSVNFEESVFDRDLTLNHVFAASSLSGSRISMNESFSIKGKSIILGALDLENSRISGDLSADDVAVSSGIDLSRDIVSGDLRISQIDGALIADRIHVFGDVEIFDDALLKALSLVGAKIDGDLRFFRDTLSGPISGFNTHVEGSVEIGGGTRVKDRFELIGIYVGRNLEISDSQFDGTLMMELGHVSQGVFIHASELRGYIDLVGANIGTHLDIAGTRLAGLDLTRAVVGGDFRVASIKGTRDLHAEFTPASSLSLRYAHLGVIQDDHRSSLESWPSKIDLEGLTFEHFGTKKDLQWTSTWLQRDVSGSSQPYQLVANMYKEGGDDGDAETVLRSAKDRELAKRWRDCEILNISSCVGAFGLVTSKTLIGYGIGSGYDQAFYWVFVLILVGAWVLTYSKTPHEKLWCVGASANKLIPVLDLSKEFKDFFDDSKNNLHGWQFIYFCFHATIGYALAFLIGAAFAGLTQAH